MFSLQPRDDHELLFHEPAPIISDQDLNMDHAFLDSPKIATKISKKRKRASKSDPKNSLDEEKKEGELKKIIHRDIERQRRQEMSTLYASLRELLPLEYIKVTNFVFSLTLLLSDPFKRSFRP